MPLFSTLTASLHKQHWHTAGPGQKCSTTTCGSGTMISVDGGATWELSTDVYGQWSARPKVLRTADEPAIVAISDKEIFMVLRSARDDALADVVATSEV